MWWILLLELFLVVVIVLLVYIEYGSFEREWFVTLTVLFGWTICFYIAFLVPNDISSSTYAVCIESKENDCYKPFAQLPPAVYLYLWEALYWTTFFFTWAIYPILQSYSRAGEFSVVSKLRSAVKQNLIFYGVAGVILAALIITIVIRKQFGMYQLAGIAIAMGNAWGLILLIGLLGVGLVNVPMWLWRRSRPLIHLNYMYFRLMSIRKQMISADAEYERVLKLVKKATEVIPEHDPYRGYLEEILKLYSPEELAKYSQGEGEIEATYGSLADIHASAKEVKFSKNCAHVLYNEVLNNVFQMEDVINSKGNPDKVIHWDFKKRSWLNFNLFLVCEYYWKCYLQSIATQVLFCLCTLLSVIIIWSETTFSFWSKLSIPALFIHSHLHVDFILRIGVFITITYMALCAIATLFKLRLFEYYHIVPHNQTNSNSLLFSAAYSCRLITPLAYNFLLMSNATNTAFFQVMGTMDVVPVLGTGLNKYLPLFVLVFSLLTLSNLYHWILSILHIKHFEFAEDFTHEQIDRGQELAASERKLRLMQRELQHIHIAKKEESDTPEEITAIVHPGMHRSYSDVNLSTHTNHTRKSNISIPAIVVSPPEGSYSMPHIPTPARHLRRNSNQI